MLPFFRSISGCGRQLSATSSSDLPHPPPHNRYCVRNFTQGAFCQDPSLSARVVLCLWFGLAHNAAPSAFLPCFAFSRCFYKLNKKIIADVCPRLGVGRNFPSPKDLRNGAALSAIAHRLEDLLHHTMAEVNHSSERGGVANSRLTRISEESMTHTHMGKPTLLTEDQSFSSSHMHSCAPRNASSGSSHRRLRIPSCNHHKLERGEEEVLSLFPHQACALSALQHLS